MLRCIVFGKREIQHIASSIIGNEFNLIALRQIEPVQTERQIMNAGTELAALAGSKINFDTGFLAGCMGARDDKRRARIKAAFDKARSVFHLHRTACNRVGLCQRNGLRRDREIKPRSRQCGIRSFSRDPVQTIAGITDVIIGRTTGLDIIACADVLGGRKVGIDFVVIQHRGGKPIGRGQAGRGAGNCATAAKIEVVIITDAVDVIAL